MTTWNVHVRGAGIAAGVQLDFCLDGFTDHEAVPPLAAGDGLTFIFPSNDRVSGVVLIPDSDKVTIEAGSVRLSVRRATAADNPVPPASGPRFVSWIVGARLP
jgi:hypothetical protein